jgi:hypothetical protein
LTGRRWAPSPLKGKEWQPLRTLVPGRTVDVVVADDCPLPHAPTRSAAATIIKPVLISA